MSDKRKKVIMDLVAAEFYVPMKEKELAVMLQVSKEDRSELNRLLNELLAEGKLSLTKKGKFIKAKHSDKELTGTFISHPKGFGFVEIDGRDEDLYIPENFVNGAFHKDTVRVALMSGQNGRRQEAQVVEVLARGMRQIVGIYDKSNKNYGFVVPDNTKINDDIFVPVERSKGAVSGHKVVCEITDYGKNNRKPEGKITEILGHVNDPGVDIMSIVKGYELPIEFSEKIMNQVERVSNEVSEADMAGRRDLRDMQMVTIDGEDAKDLDDAVSLTKDETGYHLGVHIADVTNYVQENSALDWEARARGTSVYLVDRVIPMLPHRLSNGICSLNAGENRLALSCLMTIDQKGEVVSHEIVESVIRVDRRMSYMSVRKILEDRDEAEIAAHQELIPMFERMRELAGILRGKRKKRGSIDFDFPESKIILDGQGHPVEIKPYERNVATKIIEDFMLIANETVAEHFHWMELPFVYRTHDNPDPEKISRLGTFIRNFGYSIKSRQEEIHPKELQKLLAKIAD
ncbi:MAG: ribonuclease R, partial [Lachnospiraceae bacterium]|nr:ribonuclease R [Lachnospiraceae bacterium]